MSPCSARVRRSRGAARRSTRVAATASPWPRRARSPGRRRSGAHGRPTVAELAVSELGKAIAAAALASGKPVLDAGRGQPNWLSTAPRAAAHLLGLVAAEEAEAASDDPMWGRAPRRDGIAGRVRNRLAATAGLLGPGGTARRGADFLEDALRYGVEELGFEPDAWAHELVVGALGSSYPSPTRSLTHVEAVLGRYLAEVTSAGRPPPGRFHIFGTEGGAAAMAYVFRALRENELLGGGAKIALATPIFTPYLHIPILEDFGFEVVELPAGHLTPDRFGDELIDRLAAPDIKAFFLINPGNPDSRALPDEWLAHLRDLVERRRPDLIVVTDTVYATFVDGFRSLAAEIPRNVICLHSFSKHFGATGARLGFVAVHEDSVLDELLAAQGPAARRAQQQRYRSVTGDVSSLSFVDRMVADSREVALHNIAGLATPDQVQMAMFALALVMPSGREYFERTRAQLRHRLDALFGPLGLHEPGGRDSFYYALVDLLAVAANRRGAGFATWLAEHVDPASIVLRLAAEHGVVVLPGQVFGAPQWDVRLSLASLDAGQLGAVAAALLAVIDTVPDGPSG
ncbi:MAG: bifunctional aspartate transaminase/aspartate 4-decarboxylase [Acidimicrobiia bacterium]|nr:bifunctional aspartate transaminase/aspartate 4-decarboxylase [Acidimicrobiia bacterium]